MLNTARTLVLVCCLLTVLPLRAAAQSAAFVYQGPHDIAEDWAKAVGLMLAAVSAGLIIFTLVARRNRLMEPQSKWLLFLGICVAPIPLSLLSTAVGLEQSKRVDFCSSCHVMAPFIEDMRDPNSDTLAASHFKNRYIPHEQCYYCHSDYGIFGTMEAKMAGLGHVWKESTKSYELPIKINRPYNYAICLNCHGQALSFIEVPPHEDAVKSILEGEGTCLDCHDDVHPSREDRSQ